MRDYYQKRYDVLVEIVELLEYIHQEIRYRLTPFNDILSDFRKCELKQIFVIPYLQKSKYNQQLLTQTEYEELVKICDYLRVSDREDCLKFLDEQIDRYRELSKSAKETLSKNGNLDLKLSMLLGIGIAIMVL